MNRGDKRGLAHKLNEEKKEERLATIAVKAMYRRYVEAKARESGTAKDTSLALDAPSIDSVVRGRRTVRPSN